MALILCWQSVGKAADKGHLKVAASRLRSTRWLCGDTGGHRNCTRGAPHRL